MDMTLSGSEAQEAIVERQELWENVKTEEKERINREEMLKEKRNYWRLRRAQDILFSLIALIVLSPLFLLIALAVCIDDSSGGPIFTQMRCGRDGKLFKFYKFRSMCVGAEEQLPNLLDDNEMDGPAFKIKEDPRVTRVGRFIRKTSLDELPQLFNVCCSMK